MKARYFKRAPLEELRDDVPNSLSIYKTGSFSYLEADSSKFFHVNFNVDEANVSAFKTPDQQGNYSRNTTVLPVIKPSPA
jgi:hypothetical protein